MSQRVTGDGTLKVVSRARSESFAADVRAGRPFKEALKDGRDDMRHDAVVGAALAMLAEEGSVDMKRLATAAGMSRASLYRHYPDRRELVGEIAALGVTEMHSLVADLAAPAARIRAVGQYLVTHPAHACAMREMVEQVSADALDTVAEQLVGSAVHAPWLIGIAAMCASPAMTDQDVARVRRHIDELADLVET